MIQTLIFHQKPELKTFKNLNIDGYEFHFATEGIIAENNYVLMLPNIFRHPVNLEVIEMEDDLFHLMVVRRLTRDCEALPMTEGLSIIRFNNAEIADEVAKLFDKLVDDDLAYYKEW